MNELVRLTTRPSRNGKTFVYRLDYVDEQGKRRRVSLGALVLSQGSSILSADSGSSGNITMIVEGEQSTPSIQRFIRTLNQHLIAQFPDMQSVDLRYPNGFAIHWKNGERPVSLEKTGSEFGAGSDTGNSIE